MVSFDDHEDVEVDTLVSNDGVVNNLDHVVKDVETLCEDMTRMKAYLWLVLLTTRCM